MGLFPRALVAGYALAELSGLVGCSPPARRQPPPLPSRPRLNNGAAPSLLPSSGVQRRPAASAGG